MGDGAEQVKHVNDLTPDDFRRQPVWTWYDDDAALVRPVEPTPRLPDDDETLAYFILCEIVLRDGTRMEGEVSVSLHTRSAYGLTFFQGEDAFTFVGSVLPGFGGGVSHLMTWLQKPVEAFAPIRYVTRFAYADGTPIAGEIDLRTW